MTTLTANENAGSERIWKTWELPRGAKVQVHYKRKTEGKELDEGECIAVFKCMDGAYGLWYDEKTNEPLIFNGKFKQVDGNCFVLLSNGELNEILES